MKPRDLIIGLGILIVLGACIYLVLARRNAELTRVASARNLQQWGIALNLYLIDNENQLPKVGIEPISADQNDAWFNALPPYLSQSPLAELAPGSRPRPGVPSLWIDPASKPVRVWDPNVFFFNYGMNQFLQPQEAVRSFRIYEITHPANVVFLTEVNGYSPAATPATTVFPRGNVRPTNPKAQTHVLFCDGHVGLVSRADLVDDPAALSASAATKGVSWFKEH